MVPPQFTAYAASGIQTDPQSCIGLTRLHLLLVFSEAAPKGIPRRPFFCLAPTGSSLEKGVVARTDFHPRVWSVKLQMILSLSRAQVNNFHEIISDKNSKSFIFFQNTGRTLENYTKMVYRTCNCAGEGAIMKKKEEAI